MKKLTTLCLFSALLAAGCNQSNPAPKDISALLAASQMGRANQNGQTQQPQIVPPAPPTNPNQADQVNGGSNGLVKCADCRQKCMGADSNWSTTDPFCQTCKAQIIGCSDDYSVTYYQADLAGKSQQDIQRMDAYPNFHIFNGPTGASQFGPWTGPGGGFQFQSQGFRQLSPIFSRTPCGNMGYSTNCSDKINTDYYSRCQKVIRAMDQATHKLEQGASPAQARNELVRVQSDVDQLSGKSEIHNKFSNLLNQLGNAGENMFTGLGEAAISIATGITNGVVNRGLAIGYNTQNSFIGRMQGLAQGVNYLSGQNPDSPCDPVNCDGSSDVHCDEAKNQYKIACDQ